MENDQNYIEYEAFKTFAKLHPIEAYDLEPIKFCNWMRSEGYNLTNEQIETLVNETR